MRSVGQFWRLTMPAPELPLLAPVDMGDAYKLDIDYYLKHDFADIGEATETLPAIIEYVNSKLQSITEQRLIAKQEIKRVESTVYFELKEGRYEDLYSGRPTEQAMERAVHLDERVMKAHESHAVLAGWSLRLTNLLISLQLKLDMIRSTEATRRELSKGEPPDE